MQLRKRRLKKAGKRQGAMLVLIAITLIIFVVALVFSIDVAYMQLVRSQLRAAADAAARAGAQTLSTAQDEKAAVKKAIDIAAENVVAGDGFKLAPEDVEIGKSVVQKDGSWDFVPGGQPYSAIRVNAERTAGSVAGPVRLLVGGILGRQTFEPRHVATASQVDQDVVLVIDRSGSMAWDLSGRDGAYPPGGAECNDPHATLSRWAAARAAVNEFLNAVAETRPQEQVAIVSFSTDLSRCGMNVKAATIDSDLNLDYSKASSAMTNLSNSPIPGGTNISAGMDLGVKAFKGKNARTFAQKTMIVMTDGIWNDGRRPADAARDAAAAGITVHTITFCSKRNEADMRDAARVGGGKHYHAPDAAALKEIYEEIAFTLPIILTE